MDMHVYVYVYVYIYMHAYLNGHIFVYQVRVYCTNFSRDLPSRLTTLVVITWYKTVYIEDKSYVLEVSDHV